MQKLAFLLLLFWHCSSAEWKPCKKRKYDHDSFVCVCTSEYCDSPEPVGNFDGSDDNLVYFVSDPLEKRLARFELAPNADEGANANNNLVEVRVNASEKRQRIFGFGGAFTDAAGINMNALDEETRQALLKAYFDKEIGIGYTVGRVPIASCDFSTHEYSYLDKKDDFNLTTFALAKEDFELKIPIILKAKALVGDGEEEELLLFASPWSAPGWMKNTERMVGWGWMKGPVSGPYYATYAQYFRRFFEEYAKNNVQFWGLTIENEPGAGLVPFYTWQAMYLSATTQRQFAVTVLAPELKKSPASKNVKIMAHDDQRNGVFSSAEKFYETADGVQTIAGIAFHWYSHSEYSTLTKTHNLRPDKFMLATEACTGYNIFEHNVLLGDWSRGREYAHDILNDLRNWVVGWTDWNLCLDLKGGPNFVKNFVDAPIIVNASAGEFYKQPMFYAMAHFSRFVPRNSFVLSSALFSEKGIELPDRPLEKESANDLLDFKKNAVSKNPVEHVAFETPNGLRVLVLINPDQRGRNVSVFDQTDGRRWTVPLGGDAIVTAIWKAAKKGGEDGEIPTENPSKNS